MHVVPLFALHIQDGGLMKAIAMSKEARNSYINGQKVGQSTI